MPPPNLSLSSHPPSLSNKAMGAALLRRLKSLCTRRRTRRLTTNFNCLSTSFSAAAVTTQLGHVFSLIDSNGDGKISPLELGEVLLCLGHKKSAAAREAEGMVREADRNGDGFIDLDEFMQAVDSNSDDDLREAFHVFDTDGNGYISARELRRVLVGLGHAGCSLKECRLMIRGVDRNGDGLVDFEEFRAMMSSGQGFHG